MERPRGNASKFLTSTSVWPAGGRGEPTTIGRTLVLVAGKEATIRGVEI